MDVDVWWKVQCINFLVLFLDDMDVYFKLDVGLFCLELLNFGVVGGDICSIICLDVCRDIIVICLQVIICKVQFGCLFFDVKLVEQVFGGISGNVDLVGIGNLVVVMFGSLDGNVGVVIGCGYVGNLIMELVGLDVVEFLKFLFIGDKQIFLCCGFGDFSVGNGVMCLCVLVLDIIDILIVGEGMVDLKQEQLDLLLCLCLKDISILVLCLLLCIGGIFKDLLFCFDFKVLGLWGVIVLILGSIILFVVLLVMIEIGLGKDSDCGGYYVK